MVSLHSLSARELRFHVGKEQKGAKLFLTLRFDLPSPFKTRKIYRDTLLEFAKGRDALQFIIAEELNFQNISPKSSAASTYAFNCFHIRIEHALNIFQQLQSVSSLYYANKALQFSSACLLFEYEIVENELIGKVWWDGEKLLITEQWLILPGTPCIAIFDGKIAKFPTTLDWKWLRYIYPKQKHFVSERERKEWLEELTEPFAPRCIAQEEKKQAPMTPFLVLRDRSGAFADLWFDYHTRKVAFNDQTPFPSRTIDQERYWEKDLLESGYQKKLAHDAQFFCPLDRVSGSLAFLLEMGWKIVDERGKNLMQLKNSQCRAEMQNDQILITGQMNYENGQISFQELSSALKEHSPFVELSDQAFGLIEKKNPLISFLQKKKLQLPKEQVGSLEQIIALINKTESSSFTSYYHQLQNPAPILPLEPFTAKLYPYQESGLGWLKTLIDHNINPLLADEMGLGKTVQVLALLSHLLKQGSALIVCPSSLLFNWKKEIEKFLPGVSCTVYAGAQRSLDEITASSILLTSYAILRQDLEELQNKHFRILILDEAQTIKNPKSQIFQAVCSLQSKTRLTLTGTPVENRLSDLTTLFRFLMPKLISSNSTLSMKQLLRPFILRRTKALLAHELPEKISQVIWVDMTDEQRQAYESFLQSARCLPKEGKRLQIFEVLLRLRQLCCHPSLFIPDYAGESGKLQRLLADLEEMIEEGRKGLVYSQFTSALQLIKNECEKRRWRFVYLDGSTQDRAKVVEQFQNDPEISIFLISLKAGGVGLNLTAADYVFLFDPWWNLAAEEQAIDRAHRIGRKDPVIARRYICASSIEEKVMQLKSRKGQLVSELFDEENPPLDIQDLYQLIDEES